MRSRATVRVVLAAVLSFAIAGTIVAQNWSEPQNDPPVNNAGQPPTLSDFSTYVRKSVSTLQTLEGPLNVNQGSGAQSQFADPDATRKASVIAHTASIDSYPDGNSGIFGYGSGYGVYGLADGDAGGTQYGVVGEAGHSAASAASFYGPIQILNDSLSGSSGMLAVDGTTAADRGFSCDEAASTPCVLTDIVATSPTATAVYSISSGLPGIEVALDDGVIDNGTAVLGYPDTSYGIVGLGAPGIHGKADGLPSENYIGIYGYDMGTTNGRGIYGLTQGGLGSGNYGTGAAPSYDLAAGIRACVKDGAGAVTNENGIYGSGGTYAGYFNGDGGTDGIDDGDILIADRAGVSGSGRLYIGSTFLTEANLRGILCKSGVAQYCP